MKISTTGTKRLAFLATILLHLGFLAIPLTMKQVTIETEKQVKIPVEVSIETITTQEKKNLPSPSKTIKKKKPKKRRQKGDQDTPSIASSPAPYYPKEALSNGWQGRIVVQAKIDPTGKVIDYKILKSTSHKSLDDAFIRTLKNRYRFKPKRLYGKNKSGYIKVSYRFKL